MKLARLGFLVLLTLLPKSGYGGTLDAYSLTSVFNAGVAVPGISIGGVYFDESEELLYVSGSTDISIQPSIRVFTTSGSVVRAINALPPPRLFGGIAAIPGTSDFLVTEIWNEEYLYRMDRVGSILQTRVLDASFIAGGTHNVGDVAVNSLTGNYWLAESSSPYRMIEIDSSFNVLRSIDMLPLLGNQGIPGHAGVTGLDIDPVTGNFFVSGSFGKDAGNNVLGEILEIDSTFSTILSRFTAFPTTPEWRSITDLSIAPQSRKIYAVSGTSDRVFTLSIVPEPSAGTMAILGGSLLCALQMIGRKRLVRRGSVLTGHSCQGPKS